MVFENLPLRRSDTDQDALVLDEYLPEYDVTKVRSVVVDAPVEVTYQAIETADLTQTGAISAVLNALRALPETLRALTGAQPAAPTPDRVTFGDIDDAEGWVRLAREADREFVFGAVGRFWQPTIEWRDVDATAFTDFDEPGWGKIGASISVRPYGRDRSLLTFEARTATTDPESRRRFRRYWLLIGPFAGFVMGRALDRIATDAETADAIANGEKRDVEATPTEIPVA